MPHQSRTIYTKKGRKSSEYKLSMSLDQESCHMKSECLNMLHYVWTKINNGNNAASLVTVDKIELISMTVMLFCLLIFQGSGDEAALAKMLKVIRFLVGHLLHLVKVKICSSLPLLLTQCCLSSIFVCF